MDKPNISMTVRTSVLIAVAGLILVACGISRHRNPTIDMFLPPISRLNYPGEREACWGKQGRPEWDAIDEGHRLYRAGNQRAAIRHWRGLWHNYKRSRTDVACAALENVAIGYWDRHQYRDAIGAYHQLLSTIDGRDSIALYYACLAMSDLHVELSNVPEALHFAEMAKVQQAEMFYTCGSAALRDRFALCDRIEQLEHASRSQATVCLRLPAIRPAKGLEINLR